MDDVLQFQDPDEESEAQQPSEESEDQLSSEEPEAQQSSEEPEAQLSSEESEDQQPSEESEDQQPSEESEDQQLSEESEAQDPDEESEAQQSGEELEAQMADEESEFQEPGQDLLFQVPDIVLDFDDSILRSIGRSVDDGISLFVAQNLYSQGYLSSSALDTFDRVVSGLDYRYYAAYRYDNDSYNSVLYLADSMEVSAGSFTLLDALQVMVYRVRNGSSGSTYFYYYSTSSIGDVTLSLSGSPMYYTNCVAGYPLLGGVPAPSHYPAWVVLMFGLLLVILFFVLRRRK